MFTKINFDTWDRTERYNHFMKYVPCDYNITANIDITELYKISKERDVKLYPSLIYILTCAVNEIKEMRLGYNEEKDLGVYDICHPSYTIANAGESSFSGIWTYAQDNFSQFYSLYLKDVSEFSRSFAYAPKAFQPQNTFYVSCTPEISFTSLDINLYKGAENLTPMFTLGKYFKQADRTVIPLAAHFHHAACDGFHAALFYKKVQKLSDEAQDWLII